MFTSVNHVECPRVWLFHPWHNTRCVHSTHGITRDVSIPCYRECGPHEHITRFGLPMSCYHAFPSVENEVTIERYCILVHTEVNYQGIPSEIPLKIQNYYCAWPLVDHDIILQPWFITRKVLLACYVMEWNCWSHTALLWIMVGFI